jgi:hypothetical protein
MPEYFCTSRVWFGIVVPSIYVLMHISRAESSGRLLRKILVEEALLDICDLHNIAERHTNKM